MQQQLEVPRTPLRDHAVACADVDALLAVREGVAWLEVHPEGAQQLQPATWKGGAVSSEFHSRTRRLPSVRIYSLNDAPMVLGILGLVNAGTLLDLDYLDFCETSRLADFARSCPEMVEALSEDRARFALPAAHLHVRGDCAVLVQTGDHAWGHWLVDVIPRIKVLRHHLPDVTIAVSSALRPARELLVEAGISLRQVVFYDPAKTVLSADRLFVPSFVRFANAFSPLARDIFPTLSRRARTRDRRLYVTRSATPLGSSLTNSGEVERVFERHGFEIVSPEAWSVERQVGTFAQASFIAGEYGSGLHNSVYSARGTRVLCLQSDGVAQFVQAGIGAVMDQPTGFVLGRQVAAPDPSVRMSPSQRQRLCTVSTRDVEEALQDMLADAPA
ncbi:glycosyltransferase family 61 protein [Alkalisalibacterium limincola]|uniref:Glycosyltransferase family 61 protein n=1 Tax=Alkalisalibacterium limincola TaxID=2699169 RepID=A0A5C8KY94_9GAMM|nr:glycosyltransferase 61 family protein [Alkalisalibacterium limincola]TXK64823.1 glycosyltransferase family 61 protein [Alkalisalibacterium limincola]